MYQWNPDEYKNNSSNQKLWGSELLSKLHLLGNEKVLDIGCGDGELTFQIAAKVPHGSVIGTDNSEDMIRLAKQNYDASNFPNLSFAVKDARELDFNDDFNVVFSNACLHWVIDQKLALNGIYRCLKKGGRILLQMGGHGNGTDFYGAIERVTNRKKWIGFFKGFTFPYGYYTVQEYREFLLAVKFQIQRVEILPRIMTFEDEENFASWIRTTALPFIHRLPESSREDFIHEIVSEYLQNQPPNEEKLIKLKMARLEVEADKLKI